MNKIIKYLFSKKVKRNVSLGVIGIVIVALLLRLEENKSLIREFYLDNFATYPVEYSRHYEGKICEYRKERGTTRIIFCEVDTAVFILSDNCRVDGEWAKLIDIIGDNTFIIKNKNDTLIKFIDLNKNDTTFVYYFRDYRKDYKNILSPYKSREEEITVRDSIDVEYWKNR